MLIAIIDDGINPEHFQIGSLYADIEILESGEIHSRTNAGGNVTHGTYCAGIIRSYVSNAEFYSIKVLSEEDRTGNVEKFVAALELCFREKIHLINLSLGSREISDSPPLRKAVNQLIRNGQIIVAAQANQNVYTLPASFSGVIGVRSNVDLHMRQFRVLYNDLQNIQFAASSRHVLSDGCGQSTETTSYCNSYAAPFITSLIASHSQYKELASPAMAAAAVCDAADCKSVLFSGDLGLWDSAVVINLSDCSLFQNQFGFRLSKIYTKSNLNQFYMDEPDYVIIIPNFKNNMDELFAALQHCSAKILGIAYAGSMPEKLLQFCLNIPCFWWDEDTCRKKQMKKRRPRPIGDCPVYCVQGDEQYSLLFAQLFEEYLALRGFSSKLYSDISRSYLYGIENLSAGSVKSRKDLPILDYAESCIFFCTTASEESDFDLVIKIENAPPSHYTIESDSCIRLSFTNMESHFKQIFDFIT